jgi:starch synthase (maltosyl-transferring)
VVIKPARYRLKAEKFSQVIAAKGTDKWSRVPMALHENDRWTASFTPTETGRYVYVIEAWTDVFATWRRDFLAKREAGMDVTLEIEEGLNLLTELKFRTNDRVRLIRDIRRKLRQHARHSAFPSAER